MVGAYCPPPTRAIDTLFRRQIVENAQREARARLRRRLALILPAFASLGALALGAALILA